tara:strand:- start:909 stop:1088 length:180 start_codon:yes stop_codon:yes gene_type:complete
MTNSQNYLLNQINNGRTFKQYAYKNTTKLQFSDNMETVNIKTVMALRKKGHSIVWEINN